MYYASTSRRLVDDLSRLLLRFGISTRIRATSKAGYRGGWTLDVSGGVDDQRRFLQEIGVHGGARGVLADRLLQIIRDTRANTNVDTVPRQVWDDVRELLVERGMTHRQFAEAIGTQFCGSTMWKHSPSRQRLGRIAEVLESEDLEIMAVNDLLWDEVVAIEPAGEQAVYDATVVGTHNFIANGIAVHNSIEQDADMVILLHREDAYEKESPARRGRPTSSSPSTVTAPTDTITVAFQGALLAVRGHADVARIIFWSCCVDPYSPRRQQHTGRLGWAGDRRLPLSLARSRVRVPPSSRMT